MTSIFKRIKIAAAVVSMLSAAAAVQAAPVGQPITVHEGAITGALSNTIFVDQLSGQYDEVFTATSATTFVTEAIFNAGGWFKNGAAVGSQLNFPEAGIGCPGIACTGAGIGYGLYAKFEAAGTFVGGVFTGSSAKVEIWADPLQDTNYDIKATATGSIANLTLTSGAGSITDDQLLGTATLLLSGDGNSNPGSGSNGNFELLFGNWTLNGPPGLNGDAYFFAPRPFYMLMDLNGNFQSFNPTSGTSIQLLNNSANAFWKTPEPGALALVGVALLGMGLAGRRARQS